MQGVHGPYFKEHWYAGGRATVRRREKALLRGGVRKGFTVEVMVWTLGVEGCVGVQQAGRSIIACVKTQSYGALC